MILGRNLISVAKLAAGRSSIFKSALFSPRCFSVHSARFAKYFTEKHEWVEVVDTVGTVGISDHAQSALGDVVFVELPEVGEELVQGGECGVVESVKAASDVYSPVSGKVTEINENVTVEPALINKSCYDEGWLFKLKLTNAAELEKLMSDEKYKSYLKTLEQEDH